MKLLLSCILIILGSINLNAQDNNNNQDNSLEVKQSMWGGLHYYQNGVHLYKADVKPILRSNPQALELYQSGNANKNLGSFLGFVGGFAIGYCGYGLLVPNRSNGGNNSANIGGLLVGLGTTIFAFSVESQGKEKIQQAIQMYNQGVRESSNETHLGFVIGNNGLGLKLIF